MKVGNVLELTGCTYREQYQFFKGLTLFKITYMWIGSQTIFWMVKQEGDAILLIMTKMGGAFTGITVTNAVF